MLTLLERANILLMQSSEVKEEAVQAWLNEYRTAERDRIRTMPTVAWHGIAPREVELSWVEVVMYSYRWDMGATEGYGNAWVYYDTEARIFYRKLQDGAPGHGAQRWHQGEYVR